MAQQQQQAAIDNMLAAAAQAVEDKLDEELEQLNNLGDQDLAKIRKQRILQVRERQQKTQQWLQQGHGEYTEIKEQELIKSCQKVERLIAHFYRSNLYCEVVDKACLELCKRHIETKFVKLNAEKNLYLSEQWNIKQLPTLVMIKNGKVAYYIRGLSEFQDSVNTPQFPKAFEQVLLQQEMLYENEESISSENRNPNNMQQKQSSVRKGIYNKQTESDEDSDFE